MAVTLKDIAQRVGKSVTTVSRALNDYDDVGEETKARVRQVAEELGYTPSILAQRLQKRQSETIGLILPTFGPRFSDPFFSEFIAGIGNRAAEAGYDLLVSTRPPGEREIGAYRRYVGSRRVDGFIVVRTRRQDARIDFLREAGAPFVAFGRTDPPLDYPFVDEDSALGMRRIGSHLAEYHHRVIACITPPDSLTFTHERLRGLREGLAEHGLQLRPDYIRESDLTQRGGYEQARQLLALPEPPTAIVASNDLMALGAITAARERGLRVGRDVSITGFDDIPMAEHSHPSLTTVHQPIYQIGGQVCGMLIQIIHGEQLEESQILLQPRLIPRQSSGPAPMERRPI